MAITINEKLLKILLLLNLRAIIPNIILQSTANATPHKVIKTQQKIAILKLANQGTPIQVIGCTPVIQNKAKP